MLRDGCCQSANRRSDFADRTFCPKRGRGGDGEPPLLTQLRHWQGPPAAGKGSAESVLIDGFAIKDTPFPDLASVSSDHEQCGRTSFPARLSRTVPGGDEAMARHFIVQRLSRDLEIGGDLADVTLVAGQGFPDQFGLIGLDLLDQAFIRRGI
jgi:hypothetical protein